MPLTTTLRTCSQEAGAVDSQPGGRAETDDRECEEHIRVVECGGGYMEVDSELPDVGRVVDSTTFLRRK